MSSVSTRIQLGARLVLAGALFLALAGTAGATDVTPIFLPGNPNCTGLGYDFGLKVDPPNAGTYSIDGLNSVTVATADGIFFDWSSTLGMDAVIVKGGPNANVYVYSPERTSDTGRSPVRDSEREALQRIFLEPSRRLAGLLGRPLPWPWLTSQ